MFTRKLMVLSLSVFCLCLVAGGPALAQEEGEESDWIWGEVVSVDPQQQTVTIKHLDYETYNEVEAALKTDEKTVFENAKDLSEIKSGDRITADYHLEAGVKVVELLVLEKPELTSEPAAEAEAPAQESPEPEAQP